MSFTVIWTPTAERDLARLWLGSRFRDTVTVAANAIDAELRRRPHECGESRERQRRIMFESPLAVEFEIVDEQRTVYVEALWAY
jgi:hypothetical protein